MTDRQCIRFPFNSVYFYVKTCTKNYLKISIDADDQAGRHGTYPTIRPVWPTTSNTHSP